MVFLDQTKLWTVVECVMATTSYAHRLRDLSLHFQKKVTYFIINSLSLITCLEKDRKKKGFKKFSRHTFHLRPRLIW